MFGDKLEAAKAAANKIVDLLTQDDRVALIIFGGNANSYGFVFADDTGKAQLKSRIEGLKAAGLGDVFAALDEAYSMFCHTLLGFNRGRLDSRAKKPLTDHFLWSRLSAEPRSGTVPFLHDKLDMQMVYKICMVLKRYAKG